LCEIKRYFENSSEKLTRRSHINTGNPALRASLWYTKSNFDEALAEAKKSLAANDGWIVANLKPCRLRAYSQVVIKYAFC